MLWCRLPVTTLMLIFFPFHQREPDIQWNLNHEHNACLAHETCVHDQVLTFWRRQSGFEVDYPGTSQKPLKQVPKYHHSNTIYDTINLGVWRLSKDVCKTSGVKVCWLPLPCVCGLSEGSSRYSQSSCILNGISKLSVAFECVWTRTCAL